MIYYKPNHEFYHDIESLLEELMDYGTSPEAWEKFKQDEPLGLEVIECESRPIYNFAERHKDMIAESIIDIIPEEKWPEDPDLAFDDYKESLKGLIDLEKINELMPKVWIPTKEKTHYSLEQLEELL